VSLENANSARAAAALMQEYGVGAKSGWSATKAAQEAYNRVLPRHFADNASPSVVNLLKSEAWEFRIPDQRQHLLHDCRRHRFQELSEGDFDVLDGVPFGMARIAKSYRVIIRICAAIRQRNYMVHY
jgi:hypothetical protein